MNQCSLHPSLQVKIPKARASQNIEILDASVSSIVRRIIHVRRTKVLRVRVAQKRSLVVLRLTFQTKNNSTKRRFAKNVVQILRNSVQVYHLSVTLGKQRYSLLPSVRLGDEPDFAKAAGPTWWTKWRIGSVAAGAAVAAAVVLVAFVVLVMRKRRVVGAMASTSPRYESLNEVDA